MRNISCAILIFFLSWTIEGVTVLSAQESAGINGTLMLPDASTDCADVTVNVEQSFGVEFRHSRTDWLCNFTFNDLEPNVYYLHVNMPGYIEARQPVHVEQGMKLRVALSLERAIDKPAADSPSGSPIVDASEILSLYPE